MVNPSSVVTSRSLSKHERSSIGLSRQSTNKSQQSLPKLRKATQSAENLSCRITDRVMEPRCDNEDLKMISGVGIQGAEEFSQVAQGGGEHQTQNTLGQIGDIIQVDN